MANRYWSKVSNGNWGDANAWATTEGGDPTGIATPTLNDDVFFTSTKNTNCAVAATAACKSLSFNSGTGKYTGTLSGSSALSIYGSLLLSSAMTRTYSGTITFAATGAATITCDTKALASSITVNGEGGSLQLVDELNISTSNTLTVTNGSIDTNDQTVTCGIFTVSSGADGLDLGNSTINCDLGFTYSSSVDPVVGNSVIKSNGGFNGNGKTWNDVEINGATGSVITGSNGYRNFTRTGTATLTNFLTFPGGGTQTVSGTFTCNGNSAINRIYIQSSVKGTAYTINAAVVSINATDIQDCIGAGAASWDLSAAAAYSGNCGGNTLKALGDAAFTTADSMYWLHPAAASDNWSTVGNWFLDTAGGGGAGRVPLPQDSAIFDAGSFAADGKTVVQDMPRIGSVTFADTDQAFTFTPSAAFSVFGNITLDSNLTFGAGTPTWTFEYRGVQTLDSAGKTLENALNVNSVAGVGTLKIKSDLTLGVTRRLSLQSGTFTCVDGATNSVLSTGLLSLPANGTLTMGSATHLLTGTGTTTFNNTGGTVSASTGTIKFTDTSNTAITAVMGTSKSYNNIWFDRGASTATNTITATTAVTFADIKDTGTEAHTDIFPNCTINHTSLNLNGSSGKLLTLSRTGASGYWSPTDTTGTNTVTYCSISNSHAGGGASYVSLLTDGNVDGGGNSGWLFAPVSGQGGMASSALCIGIGI